jgi:hypothetical protein
MSRKVDEALGKIQAPDRSFGCDSMNHRRPKITRLALLVLAFVALLITSWRLPSKPWSLPVVPVYLASYTNSGAGTEALFMMTNPPNASIELLSVRSVDQAEGGAMREKGRFSWGRRETWGLVYAVGVETTNEPLRVVWKFQLRRRGPKRILEQARELFGQLTGREHEYFTGTVFFVTNETRHARGEL